MSRKRENVRQCKAIRQLIDDNKYTKALELIDAIPLEEVGSLDDLYRYAELYEKAERMDKKERNFLPYLSSYSFPLYVKSSAAFDNSHGGHGRSERTVFCL